MHHVAYPTVSVVIPTIGRPEQVCSAIDSVLAQSVAVLEVLVVVDGPDARTCDLVSEHGDPRVRLVELAESQGPGGARNLGISQSHGEFVALLDDDDTWRSAKLERQMSALQRAPAPESTVISCQAVWHTGVAEHVWPTRPPRHGERVADYLFLRKHAGEGVLATPTLMLPAVLARRCPMPNHLRTHEDWEWLLRLQEAGAAFHVVMEPLVDIDARRRRESVSTSAGWRASLAWGLSRADTLGPKAFSAFVLNEPARLATLDGAGLRSLCAIGAVGMTGRPDVRSMARFATRPLGMRKRGRRSL